MKKILGIILILFLVSGCQKKDDRIINATYRCKRDIYDEKLNAYIYGERKYEKMESTKQVKKKRLL